MTKKIEKMQLRTEKVKNIESDKYFIYLIFKTFVNKISFYIDDISELVKIVIGWGN